MGNEAPGVISPVTSQASITITTCADSSHADEILSPHNKNSRHSLFGSRSNDKEVVRRVESHLVALKRKKRGRYAKGSGSDLVNHFSLCVIAFAIY